MYTIWYSGTLSNEVSLNLIGEICARFIMLISLTVFVTFYHEELMPRFKVILGPSHKTYKGKISEHN